jgi:hypothetical protein
MQALQAEAALLEKEMAHLCTEFEEFVSSDEDNEDEDESDEIDEDK